MALQTAERVSARDASDNFVFQRSILAYYKAAELVSGRVLEHILSFFFLFNFFFLISTLL